MDRVADSALNFSASQVEPLGLAAEIPATAHLSIISTLPGLLALESQWRTLEQSASTPTSVFQTFDWIAAWCKTYCSGDDGIDIHLIAGFDKSRLVFVWPLSRQTRKFVRVLSGLTEPFGQYGDVICAKSENPRTWIAAALRYMGSFKGIDILRLRHVREDSTLATVAADQLVCAKLNERAPYLDLTAFKTEADYENRYTSAQRKRRKKIRKHLEEMGPVTFTQLPLGNISDRAIDQALSEKNAWLVERGRINRVLKCPGHADFLKRLSHTTPQGVDMVVTELRAGDNPVSWEIAFRFGGTHFAYITSHVNALTDLSPGRLHFDYSQRACLAAGLQRYDLMVPYDPHKESWSSAMTPTEDYFLPFTLKGRIAGHAYLSHIRPALRNVYYRLPQWALRLINPARPKISA